MQPDRSWPADRVERRPVAALVPYATNARLHSEEQVAQLAASIREWGWTVPVLVDEQGVIIAGHGRVLAARRLGLIDVPVMVATGWTEAQRRAYVLADNRLALNAEWDETILNEELKAIADLGFDAALAGFDEEDLAFLTPEEPGPEGDPDAVPEVQERAVARVGDVWILGAHRITCGDSTDRATVDRLLAGERPHLMVTDPPYGVNYDPAWRNETGAGKTTSRTGKVLNDDRADWREAWAIFPGDVAYVWHGALHTATVAESLVACGFNLRAQIIWAKERLVLGSGDYHWQHEPCWYVVRDGKPGRWAGDRKQTTLWQISARDQDAETIHGTQKPIECMRRPIENNSEAGDAVYEPFSGSGTTLIAAHASGRRCFAVELNPLYVDVAVRRWQSYAGKSAVLDGDGRTFDAVAEERLADTGGAGG